MHDVYIVGVGMTQFAKHLSRSIKDLTREAVTAACADVCLNKEDIQAAWFSNSMWGYFSEQHCIRGEVALRSLGIMGIPITNVENACAGGSTALHNAWMGVASGLYECALAVGAEKIYNEDKIKTFRAFSSGVDVELLAATTKTQPSAEAGRHESLSSGVRAEGAGSTRSVFMDFYGMLAQWHMRRYGTSQQQLAVIAAKNHFHSTMNPKAQFQKDMSVEEILAAREVSWPLTVPMCAPIGDGAAAAVVCSGDFLKRLDGARPVKILASILGSGTDRGMDETDKSCSARLSRLAYDRAGVGPEDIDVAEVHDATSYGELHQTEALGFCQAGQGGSFAESGATTLGGKIPVNTSGGLESRGHPIGASGIGQVYELVTQLRHEAGARQVENARIAMSENGGGSLDNEEASMGIHILERVGS